MTDDLLRPSRKPRPADRPDFEAEAMGELRTFSREHRENELGNLLLALAARWSLSFEDMVIATERSPEEVRGIIDTFRQHDEMCRANAAAERVSRHGLAFAR
ncbi:MAG: hypothetical protein ABSB69_12395 [Solirubrobacteraceae bacterium]